MISNVIGRVELSAFNGLYTVVRPKVGSRIFVEYVRFSLIKSLSAGKLYMSSQDAMAKVIATIPPKILLFKYPFISGLVFLVCISRYNFSYFSDQSANWNMLPLLIRVRLIL